MFSDTGVGGIAVFWHIHAMTQQEQVDLVRWLDGIAHIAAAVNTAVSLPTLMDLVSRTASELMGYDFCAVLLPDGSGEVMLIEGSHGLSAAYLRHVNLGHPVTLDPAADPQPPSSRAYLTRKPAQMREAGDKAFLPWEEVAREQGYRSMVAVPLLASGDALGTLNCYRRDDRTFGPAEIELLTMLADQAAIAITTARLRASEHTVIERLRTLNSSLEEQYGLVRQGEAVHDQLTAVALRGGGVQGVAEALSELLDKPVVVTEEPAGEPLARVVRGDVELTVPEHPGIPGPAPGGRLAEVRVDGVPGEGATLVAVPVLLGTTVVARIWAPGPADRLSPFDTRALEHSATVCALELLRSRTALEVEARLSGELVTDLLTGNAGALGTVSERAARLGHDLTHPHAVVVARRRDGGSQQAVLSVARTLSRRARPRALVTSVGDDVVLLWPAEDDPAGPTQCAHDLRRLMGRADPSAPVTVAVSEACAGLTDYPAAFRRTRGVVSLAGLQGDDPGVLTTADLGLLGLLLQIEHVGELARFSQTVLGPLRAYDQARGTALEQTLTAYLTHDLSTAETAAALFVHPNTVGLRIRRAEQVLSRSTTSVRDLCELQVAVSAHAVARVSPGLVDSAG